MTAVLAIPSLGRARLPVASLMWLKGFGVVSSEVALHVRWALRLRPLPHEQPARPLPSLTWARML